jgi:hypothetical protein
MRTIAVLAILVAAVIGVTPRSASAERYYPWCAWYDDWTYNCSFTTHAQCLATISGVGGLCKPNSYGPPAAKPRGRGVY